MITMSEFKVDAKEFGITKDFTGILFIKDIQKNLHYKNGKLHCEDGPALYSYSKDKTKQDLKWYYDGVYFGSNDDFTVETWREKIKGLK